LKIGELGERVGVNPKTIRYYEGIGLLPEPERRPSGYREYTEDDIGRLAFIKTAQRLGLALSEISEILAFRERDERPCDYVLQAIDRQVGDLDRRITEMEELRRDLLALRRRADRLPGDKGCYCAVIEHAQAMDLREQPSHRRR
jgi:DNA-binding transcriptional MerR regulator